MPELFPVDLTSLVKSEIEADKRPPDGKLHASSDLLSSLRHVQLRALGVPTKAPTTASQVRLMTGTLWHRWLQELLHARGVPVWTEIKLDSSLPPGWSGTADYVFWHPHYEAFVLGDLKTAKGESIFFVNRDGAKEEHIWQLSAYFHALVNMGLPMLESVGVLYLPINDTTSGEHPEPTLQEVKPLDLDVVSTRMQDRADAVSELRTYMASRGHQIDSNGLIAESGLIPHDLNLNVAESLTEAPSLAGVQERVQKKVWDGKNGVFNILLVPHWSAAYCDWDDAYCDCSTQGQTKIGHFDLDGEYHSRKGYEEVSPEVSPSERERNAKRDK